MWFVYEYRQKFYMLPVSDKGSIILSQNKVVFIGTKSQCEDYCDKSGKWLED